MSELAQLLKIGALGALHRGAGPSEIQVWLGVPLARYVNDVGVEIWKYGPLQLTIARDRLKAFKLESSGSEPLPATLQKLDIPTSQLTPYDFIILLDGFDVSWQVDGERSFDRQLCLRTEGGVRAFFDLERRELQSLQMHWED